MRRLLLAAMLISLLGVGLGAQGESLCDDDLCVPVPPGWTLWPGADVNEANPNVPTGHEIIAMAGEHPFGHAGANGIMTLERLDLAMLDQTGMTSEQLAQMHFNQMKSDAGGFVPRGEVFLTRLGNRFAHGWQGTLTVRSAVGPLHLLVWQIVASSDSSAHRMTMFLPIDLPAPPPPEPVVVEGAEEITPQWSVGDVRLDLPTGWEAWPAAEAERALLQSQAIDPRMQAVNGIAFLVSEEGVFKPSMVIASLDMGGALSTDDLLRLVNESAMTAASGTLSGEIAMPGTLIQMGERVAAIAVVRGVLIDHFDLRPIRIDQLWMDTAGQALRIVHVTDFEDESTRTSLVAVLEGITP